MKQNGFCFSSFELLAKNTPSSIKEYLWKCRHVLPPKSFTVKSPEEIFFCKNQMKEWLLNSDAQGWLVCLQKWAKKKFHKMKLYVFSLMYAWIVMVCLNMFVVVAKVTAKNLSPKNPHTYIHINTYYNTVEYSLRQPFLNKNCNGFWLNRWCACVCLLV